MKDSRAEEEIREGDRVTSTVEDLGRLPDSFRALNEGDPFAIGIGFKITPEGLVLDEDLKRYFESLGGKIWDPKEIKIEKDRAIEEIIEQIASDYRNSLLMQNHPNAAHQIFGEIRRYKLEDPETDHGQYDDRLPHVDFIPPNDPCFVFFFTGSRATSFWEGDFEYKGNLHQSYEDAIKGMLKRDYPSGHLYRSKEARTLMHASPTDFKEGEMRTLGRLYVGPNPSGVTTTSS